MEQDFSLEEKLSEIRKIVETMQKGVSDFDQQLSLFGEGNQLIKECQAYLDQSELKIQQLINGKEENLEM